MCIYYSGTWTLKESHKILILMHLQQPRENPSTSRT